MKDVYFLGISCLVISLMFLFISISTQHANIIKDGYREHEKSQDAGLEGMVLREGMVITVNPNVTSAIKHCGYNVSEAGYKATGDRIALIVVDGMDWVILKEIMKDVDLPNIRFLIENGAHGPLYTHPPQSPESWTSISTGMDWKHHGINSHTKTLDNLKTKVIWDVLSENNKTVGVVFYRFAVPAKKVNGFMISERPREVNSCPEEIYYEVKDLDAPENSPQYTKEIFDFLPWADRFPFLVSHILADACRPDFMAIGFYEFDHFGHLDINGLRPFYFDIDEKKAEENKEILKKYHIATDSFMRYFIDNNFTIILVSDHGMQEDLEAAGPILIPYKDPNDDSGPQEINMRMNSYLSSLEYLTFYEPPGYEGWRYMPVDFNKTVAYFCNPLMGRVHSLCINTSLADDGRISELIEDMRNTFLGDELRMFENITLIKTDDGVRIDFSLNPLLRNKEGFSWIVKIKEGFPRLKGMRISGRNYSNFSVKNQGVTLQIRDIVDFSRPGTHRNYGILIMYGEGIKRNHTIAANNTDITPTILYLMGLPLYREFDGEVIWDAIEEDFVKRHPVEFTDESPFVEATNITYEWNEDIIKKLKALGYLVGED